MLSCQLRWSLMFEARLGPQDTDLRRPLRMMMMMMRMKATRTSHAAATLVVEPM